MSKLEDLANINLAINAILTGAQEYRIGSRTVRRADLSVLLEERRQLEAAIANEESGRYTVARLLRR